MVRLIALKNEKGICGCGKTDESLYWISSFRGVRIAPRSKLINELQTVERRSAMAF